MTQYQINTSCEIEVARYPVCLNTAPNCLKTVVLTWLTHFNKALKTENYVALQDLFFEDSFWKDQLALSWEFRTFRGPVAIASFLVNRSEPHTLGLLILKEEQEVEEPKWDSVDYIGTLKCVMSLFAFETNLTTGRGVVRLMQDVVTGSWKAFTLFTATTELKGHEESARNRRPSKQERHSSDHRRPDVNVSSLHDCDLLDTTPNVLVVGAGHCGLATAARLRQLHVKCLVIDTEERVGDNWRNRYGKLVLHDPIWYNHLPYLSFPESWPVFISKNDLGDWLETYAQNMRLNVWTKTRMQESKWDGDRWQVTVSRVREDGIPETILLRPRHIIQATGQAGEAHIPTIKGMSSFKGFMCHSSKFRGAPPCTDNRHAVVVGCGNSAHDIAQDYFDQGWKVTMIQRSSTAVDLAKYENGKGLYRENGPSTRDADLVTQSIPTALLKRVETEASLQMKTDNQDMFENLANRGFILDWGPDGSGRKLLYLSRGGGYYINTGTSMLIASGQISIISGHHITQFVPEGLVLQSNTSDFCANFVPSSVFLAAAHVVLCTGHESLLSTTRAIFGETLADAVGPIWGLDNEGEVKRVWRPSGVRGFWVVGGNLKAARWGIGALGVLVKALEVGACTWDDLGCV